MVTQKVFRPASELDEWRVPKVKMQFTLKCIEPVNPTLLCFQEQHGRTDSQPSTLNPQPDWEPELRIYHVEADGSVRYDMGSATGLNPAEHIVHRGHLLDGIAKDCFGGPARAAMAWYLISILGRDWFARAMERYGSPFIVAKTNASDTAAVSFLQTALSLATKIGGLVVDEATSVELESAMHGDMAGGYEKFINICNRHISIHLVGQTTSAEAQSTGLGSSVGKSQMQVREDIVQFDRAALSATLREQLFKWILRFNGIRCSPPNIVWGGLDPDAAKSLGALLVDLKNAQLQPTDEALPNIGEQVGFEVERMEPPMAMPMPGGFGGSAKLAGLTALAAAMPRFSNAPSDDVARAKAAALARAFRGDLAPVLTILSASPGPDEFLANLGRFFAHWKPQKVAAVAEEALQMCAAAGAADQKLRS